uniref:Uncharacterized protein n=2 Tax=Meloidogyne TaxID=189290 RepID=A0A6V7V5H8_MELEN|nr:unnamed protein product [Meloidogyne enterolobii]
MIRSRSMLPFLEALQILLLESFLVKHLEIFWLLHSFRLRRSDMRSNWLFNMHQMDFRRFWHISPKTTLDLRDDNKRKGQMLSFL